MELWVSNYCGKYLIYHNDKLKVAMNLIFMLLYSTQNVESTKRAATVADTRQSAVRLFRNPLYSSEHSLNE